MQLTSHSAVSYSRPASRSGRVKPLVIVFCNWLTALGKRVPRPAAEARIADLGPALRKDLSLPPQVPAASWETEYYTWRR